MSARKSLAAGVAASIWSAAVGLAVVPFYLRYLGLESYGLIGVFSTAQIIIQLLDVGLTATMSREVARHFESGSLPRLANLFRTLSSVYWATAAMLAIVIALCGPLLATHWLSAQHLPANTLSVSVVLLGFVIAARWPASLYQGVLMGAHRLTTTSLVGVVFATGGSIGAVVVLAFVSPTIEAFFLWQACISMLYTLLLRSLARSVLRFRVQNRFDLSELRRVGGFTAGMSGVAITGTMLMQADKLVLSKLLDLAAFGQYMLASTVAGGLYLVLAPTFNLIFPRLSALVLGPPAELVSYFRRGTRTLTAALFPIATVAVVYARDIIFLWTRNPELASAAAPVVQLCLIGTTMNGVMHFPHALQLALGRTHAAVAMNLVLMIVTLPVTAYLAVRFGAIGGATAWAFLNLVYLLLGTWLTRRYLPQGVGRRWFFLDVCAPLVATLLVVGGFSVVMSETLWPRPVLLACAIVLASAFCLALIRTGQGLEKYTASLS